MTSGKGTPRRQTDSKEVTPRLGAHSEMLFLGHSGDGIFEQGRFGTGHAKKDQEQTRAASRHTLEIRKSRGEKKQSKTEPEARMGTTRTERGHSGGSVCHFH